MIHCSRVSSGFPRAPLTAVDPGKMALSYAIGWLEQIEKSPWQKQLSHPRAWHPKPTIMPPRWRHVQVLHSSAGGSGRANAAWPVPQRGVSSLSTARAQPDFPPHPAPVTRTRPAPSHGHRASGAQLPLLPIMLRAFSTPTLPTGLTSRGSPGCSQAQGARRVGAN